MLNRNSIFGAFIFLNGLIAHGATLECRVEAIGLGSNSGKTIKKDIINGSAYINQFDKQIDFFPYQIVAIVKNDSLVSIQLINTLTDLGVKAGSIKYEDSLSLYVQLTQSSFNNPKDTILGACKIQ